MSDSIPKPQLVYELEIDNSNSEFRHSGLPRSLDGSSRPIHPAEAFHPHQFVSHPSPSSSQPTQPPLLDSTPFTLVQDLSALRHLASKLASVDEFAVDLEYNSYRSFQGITCLMQISTRTEDFVVDTLKLRPHVGDLLGRFFSDPNKRKVLHGANNDVVWLQMDFGIYVVNMFDTMQASRVMKTERNSLEFLLRYFCGVTANKEYQCSDWRVRPLPCDMIKYAREDTHYLLYIYDLMRTRLASGSVEFGFEDPMNEVYSRSQEVCMRLYKKEVYDRGISYLYIYGLGDADLDADQLAVVAGISEWRDRVAREEDESTGYVLPNKHVLEIARKRPKKERELLDLVGYSKPLVLRDVSKIIEIIRLSISVDAPRFEIVARKLRSGMTAYEVATMSQEMKRFNHEQYLVRVEEASRRIAMLQEMKRINEEQYLARVEEASRRIVVGPRRREFKNRTRHCSNGYESVYCGTQLSFHYLNSLSQLCYFENIIRSETLLPMLLKHCSSVYLV